MTNKVIRISVMATMDGVAYLGLSSEKESVPMTWTWIKAAPPNCFDSEGFG
jgi:hypothetical protein